MTRAVVFVLFLVRVSGGRRVGSLKSGGLHVCVLFVARLREHALHSSVAIALHWVGGWVGGWDCETGPVRVCERSAGALLCKGKTRAANILSVCFTRWWASGLGRAQAGPLPASPCQHLVVCLVFNQNTALLIAIRNASAISPQQDCVAY